QRRADLAGDLDQLRVGLVLQRDAVVLQLDEQLVAPEDLLELACLVQSGFEVAVDQRLQHVATEAAGGRDHAVAVVGEHLPVDLGLAVVALEEPPARELDQVAVAGVVLRQQREVVPRLLAALALTAGVVDLAAGVDALVPAFVGLVRLEADDRGDAGLAASPVERQDPVHVAVVGDAERGLAVGGGRGHEVVHPGGPVQHRELGVGVEVDEALPVSHSEPVPSSSHPRVAHTRLWTTYTGVISTVAAVRAALPRATTKVSRRCWVARATSSTARANAASFTFEGLR